MRIAVLGGDLLFGSKVMAMLEQAGHDVTLTDRVPPCGEAAALVVDLTTGDADVVAIGASSTPTLGFYAHVEPEVRAAALAAGFDVVVPRSRFAREGAALLDGLLSSR